LPKPQLYLHIGHGKTGTSATQSAFAIAQEDLLRHQIEYPITLIERKKASQFAITSGNWKHNPEEPLAKELVRLSQEKKDENSILLSSESLFWHLDSLFEEEFHRLKDLNLHVLLAVRDLEEMLSSEYQQRVKRHGEKRPFEQFLRSRNFISSHHKKAAHVINLLKQNEIKTTIINYSKHKKNITELIFEALQAQEAYPREAMHGVVVNRSMSQKELSILTLINALYYRRFPWISARLSDALVKQLPNVQSQECRLSESSKLKLYEINNDYIQYINDSLNPDDHLLNQSTMVAKRDPIDRIVIQQIRKEEKLSIDVISSTLLTVIQSESAHNHLSNTTIDQLIKLSQAADTEPTTRVELLELAFANRPQGQRLIKLLEQAKTAINNQS
jgi:hypothetical protein